MLKRTASSDLYRLFRNCSLAVLNSGSQTDKKQLLSRYETFDINVLRRERGGEAELVNPPEEALSTAASSARCRPTCSPCCATSCSCMAKSPAPAASST